jgi:NAD(P)-dependent dehydrogenase (short-subunit alcohol dehydrogenase family)
VTHQNPATEPTIAIIGASRGLGLALVEEFARRGFSVLATKRTTDHIGLDDLAQRFAGQIQIACADITVEEDIAALSELIGPGSLDILFVNAGITNPPEETIGAVALEDFNRVLVTNALSPMRVVERLEDRVKPQGTIAIMSSILGSVAGNTVGGWEVYRASKAALNTLMRSYAHRQKKPGRSLILMAPGWVRTDMGGPQAHLSIDESIPGVVDTVLAQVGHSGLQYLDYQGQTLPW